MIMLKILAEKIHDNRFLRLIANMLKAGYLEDWQYHETLSGPPQGGVVSPILSNIYLHKLDEYVERVLIPQYTRGKQKEGNPEYRGENTAEDRAPARGPGTVPGRCAADAPTPLGDPLDPGYRRLRYCVTPTTTSWGSPGRRPKPRRSKISWRRSCAMNSRWNSTRTRP